jgi:ABC-2 type transport system ATP-binding protein
VLPGEIVGLLGPNGSGKTTVMRMVLGLIRPTHGSIEVFGVPVSSGDVKYRERVGYLPGTLGLYRQMTVEGFLRFLAQMRQADCRVRMQELLERLELSPHAVIGGLSKGNKQKVGVVQALMHSPDLLILDEPTSGLDPMNQRVFESIIREERKKGVAVVLSSHVMHEVDELADRVVILMNGRVVINDDVAALKSRIARTLRMEFVHPVTEDIFKGVSGVEHVMIEMSDARCIVTCTVVGSESPLLEVAVHNKVESVFSKEPSLEEIFLTKTSNSHEE